MNWDAIAAVGELIGAVAVVISLLYLASQIRTSNKAARHAASREIMVEYSQIYGQLATNLETAELWLRVCSNDPDLTQS